MNPSEDIFRLAEARYLSGKPLSVPQRLCMEEALSSSSAREASIACGALLRDSKSDPRQRRKARGVLKALCERFATSVPTDNVLPTDEIAKTELSIALLLAPFREMNGDYVRAFIYGIVKSERCTLRANAVLLLGRLAIAGEASATAALRLAAGDTDPDVRKNAEIELRKLEYENDREGR